MELENEIYKKIVALCNAGNSLFEENKLDDAMIKYKEAIELLPYPKTDWEAGLWLYTAIGDIHFLKKNYEKAKTQFYDALNCPGGMTNPFVFCRLGQTLYELKDFSRAKEFLTKAYALDGSEVFRSEDPKYLNFIIDIIKQEKQK